MPAELRTVARVMAALAALGLAACSSISDGMDNASHYDGATPGTIPGHYGEPGGPLDNGIMPEPWGDTS